MAARGLSPRTAWVLLAVALLAGGAVFAYVLTRPTPQPADAGMQFVDFSEDSTATVGFSAQFPEPPLAPLARPLGAVGDGEFLYIALADAGAIGVFEYDGSHVATLTVPAAPDTPAYPVDLSFLGEDRLIVVDTAAQRVVTMASYGSDEATATFGPAEGDGALVQPTAVEVAGDAVFVADGSDGSVREYKANGAFVRTLTFNDPQPSFVGDLLAADGVLFVSDSNAGRVLLVDLATGTQSGAVQRRLALPRGLALDDGGGVFVAEAFGPRVALFDPTAQTLIDLIGESSTERLEAGGELSQPESLVWDGQSQRLYVVDSAQGRVKVYNVREEAE